jgi:hypothetical protein
MGGDRQWFHDAVSLLLEAGGRHVRTTGGHAIWRVSGRTVAVPAHARACGSPRAQKNVLATIRRTIRGGN